MTSYEQVKEWLENEGFVLQKFTCQKCDKESYDVESADILKRCSSSEPPIMCGKCSWQHFLNQRKK